MFEKFDVSLPVIKDIMFDIRDYGAVGDGAKFKIDFMYDTKTDSYQGSYKLIPIYSETRDNLYDSSVDMTEDEDTKDRDYD